MLPLADLIRRIRQDRRALELSQQQLAKLAGTSQSLIAKLESGRVNPSYETVRQVVDAIERARFQDERFAEDLMQAAPTMVSEETPLGLALDAMRTHGYSQVPVTRAGVPIGAISEASILDCVDAGRPLEELRLAPVREAMGHPLPVVDGSTRRGTILELLRSSPAVLVMRQGSIVGLITRSDLLA